MDRDTVIALAREAGLWEIFGHYSGEFADGNPEVCLEELEHFATLVAAHEREACAKVCEELELKSADGQLGTYVAGWSDGTDDCAAAIRSRT